MEERKGNQQDAGTEERNKQQGNVPDNQKKPAQGDQGQGMEDKNRGQGQDQEREDQGQGQQDKERKSA